MNEYEFEVYYQGSRTVYVRAKSEAAARSIAESDTGLAPFNTKERIEGAKLVSCKKVK